MLTAEVHRGCITTILRDGLQSTGPLQVLHAFHQLLKLKRSLENYGRLKESREAKKHLFWLQGLKKNFHQLSVSDITS